MNKQLTKTGQRLLALTAALVLALPLTASAATEELVVNVDRTRAAGDATGGGCLALLSESPADAGLACPEAAWVSFDCTGDARSNAARMFDSAQTAFVMQRQVRIRVTDETLLDDFCVVTRIDVLSG